MMSSFRFVSPAIGECENVQNVKSHWNAPGISQKTVCIRLRNGKNQSIPILFEHRIIQRISIHELCSNLTNQPIQAFR